MTTTTKQLTGAEKRELAEYERIARELEQLEAEGKLISIGKRQLTQCRKKIGALTGETK